MVLVAYSEDKTTTRKETEGTYCIKCRRHTVGWVGMWEQCSHCGEVYRKNMPKEKQRAKLNDIDLNDHASFIGKYLHRYVYFLFN